ncbi:NAD dependent epimerase/dehydratase [Histoplasma capsulatum var. duboisii H88]|uniref:NAD dependent epimerase/dehydratase n=1 Tax=Ajellomyces capsulatus (strain H88) TaxID=544711 RepID=A0A8A1L756_AJEC8|nr:NAD dependent epimerase/dehydratase [Histoplasma capsulatum var. duboisii H88]
MLLQSVGLATSIIDYRDHWHGGTILDIPSRLCAGAFHLVKSIYISTTSARHWHFVWISVVVVLFLQVLSRTFTLPASIILLNNCSPHPSVLATVHGIAQSVPSASRTTGPGFSWS